MPELSWAGINAATVHVSSAYLAFSAQLGVQVQSQPQRERNKDGGRGQGSLLGEKRQVSELGADGLRFPHTETVEKVRQVGGLGQSGTANKMWSMGDGCLVCIVGLHVVSLERGSQGTQGTGRAEKGGWQAARPLRLT